MFLQETDLTKDQIPPILEGYCPVSHTNTAGVSRAITHVKNSIKFANVEGLDDIIPHVIIKLREVTIINCYNEFTLNSYSADAKRVSKAEQVRRILDVIELTSKNANGKVIWIGDLNVNIRNRKESREYLKYCDENGLVQVNWLPTRGNACLDHVVTRNVSPHDIKVLESGLSDHKMITLKLGKKNPKEFRLKDK